MMKQNIKILFNLFIVTIVSIAIMSMNASVLNNDINEFSEKEREEEIVFSSDIDYELTDLAFSESQTTKELHTHSLFLKNSFSIFYNSLYLIENKNNSIISIILAIKSPYYLRYCSLLVYS